MDRLAGKVALISGGARGQGAAEARRFVAEGAKVVAGDVRDDAGKALADELGDAGAYVHLDVREGDDWAAAVAEAEDRFGRLDVLVNNAGVYVAGAPTHEVTLDDYRRIVEINQIGVFLGMRAAIPALVRAGGGSIVNISSTSGLEGFGGSIAYTASKFAVRGMTKVVALEYGAAGIRANSVHPGYIDTPMTRGNAPAPTADEHSGYGLTNAIPRVGAPDDVANLVLFLASDESSYCTGAEFVVDGGRTAGHVNPDARPTAVP